MSGFSRVAAMLAANHTSRATTELLRFASDGDGLPNHPFGTQDPTVELAKALIASAEIERGGMEAIHGNAWAAEVRALSDLMAACRQFVAAWTAGEDEAPYYADHKANDGELRFAMAQGRKIVFPVPYAPTRRSPEERR